MIMFDLQPCARCQQPTTADHLAATQDYAFWHSDDGLCPACLQQTLLELLLAQGDDALHAAVQTVWPLDSEAAFGALPTPLRLHADPRFTGQGVTLALIDAGFYPHPDLVQPHNRIRAWVDAGRVDGRVVTFAHEDRPQWPDWDAAHSWQWHGLMTSVVAAGNGFLSHGLYRGLASAADLVLIQVRDEEGRITNASITRALQWVQRYGTEFGVRVVSLSVAGDPVWPLLGNPVDEAVAALVDQGITVVAAAGNEGERRLVPPATAPQALTVGGIDDHTLFDHAAVSLWHSNYGESSAGAWKPELVAPSMWVAAPLLPNTAVAEEAAWLFARRRQGDYSKDVRVAESKLITPHYQHVEGTSFSAPVVAGAVACLLEAKPTLTPRLIRELLQVTAHRAAQASVERQGAGVLDVGRAVAMALQETHTTLPESPYIGPNGVAFSLHDHTAQQVQVLGDWDGWQAPGLVAQQIEAGVWQTTQQHLAPGQYSYKFLLNGAIWLTDPANPWKAPDHFGGLNSHFHLA
jgi:serine protease AprX